MTALVQTSLEETGPDPRPLFTLVGTPSALGPQLAYSLGGA